MAGRRTKRVLLLCPMSSGKPELLRAARAGEEENRELLERFDQECRERPPSWLARS